MAGGYIHEDLFNTINAPTDEVLVHPIFDDNARRRTSNIVTVNHQLNVLRPAFSELAMNANSDFVHCKTNPILIISVCPFVKAKSRIMNEFGGAICCANFLSAPDGLTVDLNLVIKSQRLDNV